MPGMSEERKPQIAGDAIDVLFGGCLIAFGICVGLPTIWDLSMTALGQPNWLWQMCHKGVIGGILAVVGLRFLRRGVLGERGGGRHPGGGISAFNRACVLACESGRCSGMDGLGGQSVLLTAPVEREQLRNGLRCLYLVRRILGR
jgi:hypothetical protein